MVKYKKDHPSEVRFLVPVVKQNIKEYREGTDDAIRHDLCWVDAPNLRSSHQKGLLAGVHFRLICLALSRLTSWHRLKTAGRVMFIK